MRKFGEINETVQVQTNKKGGGRVVGGGNLLTSISGTALATTDHNGRIIQVRSGAVALQQPTSMAVTVSKQVET